MHRTRTVIVALLLILPALAQGQTAPVSSPPGTETEAIPAGQTNPSIVPAEAVERAQALEPPGILPVVPGPGPGSGAGTSDSPQVPLPASPTAPPLKEEIVPEGPPPWGALSILGEEVPPGEVRDLSLRTSESFAGAAMDVPVVVIRGDNPGPTVCLTAGIHGDELNGVEIVREILDTVRPRGMSGTILGVPIVNLHGFQTNSRYLPDRRDLNRHFPGQPRGSSASRIAHALFDNVIRRCDVLVDLHTGSLHRSNLPQIRADLRDEQVMALARGFGSTVIVHNKGAKGTLRRAAQEAGIPAIIYEAGEPMRFQRQEIKRGVIGVRNLLAHLKVLKGGRVSLGEQRIFYETRWVRVERGGILVSDVRLGDNVREGDILASITDPIHKEKSVMVSPVRGRVIGMSLAPVMIPGYAAFHIGIPGSRPVDVEDSVDQDRPE